MSGKRLDDFRLKLGGRELAPLMQGGMGVNISTDSLALELAKRNAIGHISDAMAPFLNDQLFDTRYQANKQKRFKILLDKYPKTGVKWATEEVYAANRRYCEYVMGRKGTRGAVFANVMEKLTMGAPTETLQARLRGAMDGGIDGITLSAGLHMGSLKLVEDHPRFRDVMFGIIVSSARALKIFLRGSARLNRMPDYIVVEGPLAGGHLGFGEDWKEHDLKTIMLDVLEMLREEELDIPVIPAGGLFTGTDAVDYLELGASGVQVATRFTISQECGLPYKVKQEYLKAQEEDVVVNMSSPTGYPMRMLRYSPSLKSGIRPNCESLGYVLDKDGGCAYHGAYERAKAAAGDSKHFSVSEKMCICYQFMRYDCYTCGHNVYRLKDTTIRQADGSWFLPPATHIVDDYLYSTSHRVELPAQPAESLEMAQAG
jgi:nitronate monooxygenase